MKQYRLYIITVFVLLLSSCGNDWIDNIGPTENIETEKSLETIQDAKYMLNGVYNIMRHFEYNGARFTFYGDVKGDDMQANGATKRSALYYLFGFNSQTAPSSFWQQPYAAIRNANNIIKFANSFEGTEAELKEIKAIRAEAMTLRAMSHFDLVKIYGYPYLKDNGASLGIPIIKEPMPFSYKPKRNTVAEVFKFIIDDLEEIRNDLSPAMNKGKINQGGAALLLARAYLYTGQNKKAYDIATEAINTAEKNKFKLWTNSQYASVWADEFTSESLFELSIKTDEAGEKPNELIGYLMDEAGYNDITVTSSFANFLNEDPNDVRNSGIKKVTKGKEVYYYCMKYPGNNGEGSKYANILSLRLSDLYLIAAEAAVKENDNINALKYLNVIVERANPNKTVTGTVTLDRVLDERRKEFFGEGHRFFDALRNNKRIERVGDSHLGGLTKETRSFDWNYKQIVMAIPKSEMDVNPNMEQNPQ